MKDYTANTAITLHIGFNDRERNCLIYEGMKEMIKRDIQTTSLSGEGLKSYIISGLTLRFLDGYKVRVECEFSCYDENKQEVEGFSNYCVKGAQNRLGELGYHMESISLKVEKMDMGWLDELESMVFRWREKMEI